MGQHNSTEKSIEDSSKETGTSNALVNLCKQQKSQNDKVVDNKENITVIVTKESEDKNVNKNKDDTGSFLNISLEKSGFPLVLRWETPAKEVFVAGSFDNWEVKTQLEKSGDIFISSINLPFGQHFIKFIVDGKWSHNESLEKVNDGFGGYNNVIIHSQNKTAEDEGYVEDVEF